MVNGPLIARFIGVAAVFVMAAAGCRSAPAGPIPTLTPTVEPISYGPLAARTFVTPESVHWVDLQGEFVLHAPEIAARHQRALRGDTVEFTNTPRPTVSEDESKAVVGVRSEHGRSGVLLIRGDGTSFGMYVFEDPSTVLGNVGFASWVGLTLVGASDSLGSKIVALNNYARFQFEVPVQDYQGRILVSPDLSHIALVRDGEVELAPLETPGETTVIREGSVSSEGRDLYREALRVVSRW